jgi:1-acyl-sn-glycerol-3-phosphate acyltransferase
LYKRWQKRCIRWVGWTHVKSCGVDRINPKGPVLITPNHVGWKDIFFISGMIRRTVHFVANSRLFNEKACRELLDNYFGKFIRCPVLQKPMHLWNGYFSKFMVERIRGVGAIPAMLHSQNYSFFDAIKDAFNREKLVCIFPQGVRTGPPDASRRFKLGISKVLHDYYVESRISVPVYPVGITGTDRFYHPGMQLGFFVGAPLYIHDYIQSNDFETYISFTNALKEAVLQLIQQN